MDDRCYTTVRNILLVLSGSLEVISIYLPSHQPDEYGTRPFFRWVQLQGCSLDTPSIPKNASGPVGISLKRGTSGTILVKNITFIVIILVNITFIVIILVKNIT